MPIPNRRPIVTGPSLVRDTRGRYIIHGQLTDNDVLSTAATILLEKCQRLGVMNDPATVKRFLQARLGPLDCEHFDVLWLDSQHRLISVETLASGTIDSATVYPRIVVKAALRNNAAAAVLSHNHPSGCAEPSTADRLLTERLKQALSLIDVRVIDHFVVSAETSVSFAERGWL